MTTVVLVADFSGSEPMNVCWWLCGKNDAGILGPIVSLPMVEAGLKVVPQTVNFVSPHNG